MKSLVQARRRLRAFLALLAATALAGCVVGPDYRGPPGLADAPAPTFHRAGADLVPSPPPARWWAALEDPELDRLETAALSASPDLAVVRARLRQSRAGLRQSRAERGPTTGASAVYLRTSGAADVLSGGAATVTGAGGTGAPTTVADADSSVLQVYEVGFDATWEIDLFGGHARAIEGAKAGAAAADADLQDAEVSLTAEVAQAYLQLRAAQARLALNADTAGVEARLLHLVELREAGGTATALDVERLRDQLETTRTDAAPLRAELIDPQDRLAVLIGRAPGALDAELGGPRPLPLPPAYLAVGDPASLLRRRPDIRAAERRLAQSNALIGQRTADLFPKVTLLGDVGFGSTDIGGLLSSGSFTSAVAPILQWSPFDWGRIRAKIEGAKAGRDEADARYRQAVLGALQDAEGALSRYGRQREDLAGRLRVEASAARAQRLTGLKLDGGAATSLDLLEAERDRVTAETGVVQSKADLAADYVALQKSLGLGWGPAG